MKSKTLISLVLAASTLLFIAGCEKDKEVFSIETGNRDYSNPAVYCGMPNSDVFSLSDFYNCATNIYYPVKSKIINFHGKKYEVLSVSPEKITLKEAK